MYNICAIDEKTEVKWLCFIQKSIKASNLDLRCPGADKKTRGLKYREKVIIQPLMLIPTPSKTCNDKWNYHENGRDWECKCKEGINNK